MTESRRFACGVSAILDSRTNPQLPAQNMGDEKRGKKSVKSLGGAQTRESYMQMHLVWQLWIGDCIP